MMTGVIAAVQGQSDAQALLGQGLGLGTLGGSFVLFWLLKRIASCAYRAVIMVSLFGLCTAAYVMLVK